MIGDLESHDVLCRQLTAESGACVIAVDYRLAPEHKFPAAADDAWAATRWVVAHAAELGVDAGRLAVGGDSAGANLAAVVALMARDAGAPAIALQVLIYPVTDVGSESPSYGDFADGYMLTRDSMRWFIAHYLGRKEDAKDWRVSPLRAPSLAGLPRGARHHRGLRSAARRGRGLCHPAARGRCHRGLCLLRRDDPRLRGHGARPGHRAPRGLAHRRLAEAGPPGGVKGGMADNRFPSIAELQTLIDSSDDAIISKTLDGTITFWNRGAERIFGWTAAEAVGRHITLIIPEERHAETDEVLARIRRGERVDHFETIRVARNGHRLNISLTVSPIKDDAGRIVGASKIARDITPQRRGEITQARLAALVDSSDDAIISKTLDGVITSWNAGAERIFGWTAAEAVGRHITLIIPDDRRAEEDEVLARIRRGERVDHFETIRVARNGHRLNISLTISPIRDGAGQILGASKIARDVTERRLMEEERERLLAREQQARTQAEALNRTKDEFLATVSHELRTPLNAIFGWSRMLQSADLDDETRARAVATIVRSASAQDRLIEDLLDLSRIVTGRMRLEFEDLDLKAVIEAALDTVRPAATAKELTLVPALDVSLPLMRGAADRLQQVVWNLLMNAVKFTPRGGRVEVSVESGEGNAEIVVADTGEGISPEVLPYVFDRFRQEDSSTSRAHGGLGLGLALVRHLVELHGGRVSAESPGKGQGATFRVTLPWAPPRRTELPMRALVEPRGGGSALLRGLRVLVVDDNADALDLTAMTLRREGAEVRVASSAFRAHEIVTDWQPQILVSDLAMPGEDGFMLLRGMRDAISKKGGRKLAAIAITAYGTTENEMRSFEAGFDLYLTKPIDPLEFAAAVAGLALRVT